MDAATAELYISHIQALDIHIQHLAAIMPTLNDPKRWLATHWEWIEMKILRTRYIRESKEFRDICGVNLTNEQNTLILAFKE